MACLEERLDRLYGRVDKAAAAAGRERGGVRLLVRTRGVDPDGVARLSAAGVSYVAEARVREAAQKRESCPGGIEWHMIGRCRDRDMGLLVRVFDMVHRVESEAVLDALDAACREVGKQMPVCILVALPGDRTENGMAAERVADVVTSGERWRSVDICGLCADPPFRPEQETMRAFYRHLREVQTACCERTGTLLPELTMGCPAHLEAAIEEGATYVPVEASWLTDGDKDNEVAT